MCETDNTAKWNVAPAVSFWLEATVTPVVVSTIQKIGDAALLIHWRW